MTTAPAGLDWLVDSLTQRTPDIAHAILVSADGMPMASSVDFPPGPGRPALGDRLRSHQSYPGSSALLRRG
ncbi:roadblock/LC7 domain-containing protein [Nocardioides albertanoniae]|uniref:roadblock/LC7 domain-containing protein n=1 Tax=Nocardioides albertanoniae TaxID=1175486 RepID=UPI003CCC7E8A